MSMVVISLSDCPPKVRGDLSKWLFELNTGVYVGKLSARVREELWDRICENSSKGKATMVYSAANEQGMEFRVHNTTWKPIDMDGLTLMRRPLAGSGGAEQFDHPGFSNASKFLKARRIQQAKQKKQEKQEYLVVDLETTGLDPRKDEIIELGAVYVVAHEIQSQYSALLKTNRTIPEKVQLLTGITPDMIIADGLEPEQAIREFRKLIAGHDLVFHNAGFDQAFLKRACDQYGLPGIENRHEDTMILAKQMLEDVENYKLETIAHYFGKTDMQSHRALADCKLTWFIYEKLKEIGGS